MTAISSSPETHTGARGAAPPAVSALARAAATAPATPGVYFFLSRRSELLYVGMAKDLRRRLQQHARAPRDALYRRVAGVRWETLPDEDAAAAREADLIVALQPPYNAAIAGEGKWTYIHVAPRSRERLRFSLSDDPACIDGARVYGCFPHLGAGVGSVPGIACSDGYSAFLRLLWAASGDGSHYPGRITRGTPPETFDVALAGAHLASLHAFLSGTTRGLLTALSVQAWQRPRFMHAGLARDHDLAEAFYAFGPVAMRKLRLRAGLRPGPVEREVIERVLAEDVERLVASPAEQSSSARGIGG